MTHVKLLALENVTICSSALSRSGSDASQQSTGLELLLEQRVNLGVLLSLVEDSLDVVRLLGVGGLLGELLASGDGLGVLAKYQRTIPRWKERCGDTYVSLVPLSEGGSINVDDARLDEGLGSEQLVVGCVVSLEGENQRRVSE